MVGEEFVEMESHMRRSDFVKKGKPAQFLDHEVFLSVKQLNMDVLEASALSRSTPGSSNYREWMTWEEVGAIRNNHAGADAIVSWLESHGVAVTWVSRAKTYIKATATVAKWERILHTEFHLYEDQKEGFNRRQLVRADTYHVPVSVRSHVHAISDVSNLPARMSKHSVVKDVPVEYTTVKLRDNLRTRQLASACSGQSTVACLNEVYDVASNIGKNAVFLLMWGC